MKNAVRRGGSLLLALVMLVSITATFVSARSSLYISSYRAWLTPEAGGVIDVTIDVSAYDFMDEVGASRVQIFESKDGGNTWTSKRVYLKSLFPELVISDAIFYYETPISYHGTPGYKYYAEITVYAGDSTGSDTKEYTTGVVTAHS